MDDEKIIKAIKCSGRLSKNQAKVLEILYKTNTNNESDLTHAFLADKLSCTRAYISKIIKALKESNFIDFKYKKGCNNQVYIINIESLKQLVKAYEKKLTVSII